MEYLELICDSLSRVSYIWSLISNPWVDHLFLKLNWGEWVLKEVSMFIFYSSFMLMLYLRIPLTYSYIPPTEAFGQHLWWCRLMYSGSSMGSSLIHLRFEFAMVNLLASRGFHLLFVLVRRSWVFFRLPSLSVRGFIDIQFS